MKTGFLITKLGFFLAILFSPKSLAEQTGGEAAMYENVRLQIEKYDTIIELTYLDQTPPLDNPKKGNLAIITRVHKGDLKVGNNLLIYFIPTWKPEDKTSNIRVFFFNKKDLQNNDRGLSVLQHKKHNSWSFSRVANDPLSSIFRKAFDRYMKTDISKT